ncbi:LacI family transcriptional regulator [Exilibacterium tricleocarpae]|uniref:LacI family transcriptional regulator n=1 Tax=Exilibacterium tricleocarpae TaxID=2591008 RepID=A0A545U6T1_9GAMM|nr:LacI family DNA-binding transcriptional regulator [Exilibacterium tricleocarpae]TQV85113.1 LacI family transcriptional regulator [Exilibacterium tricleocarpae]
MGNTTIVDVAKHAGVSKKTVSRVLNAEPNVRPATREKVMQAIAALDFKRNPLGLALARKRSYLLALVYDNPSPNFLMHLQTGIMAACKARGMGLYLHNCNYQAPDLVEDIGQMVAGTLVDGLILSSPVCDQQPLIDMLAQRRIHYVSINPKDTGHGLAVAVNNRRAAFDLTDHLIGLGHRRIAYVKGHPDLASSAQREAGFRAAMSKRRLAVDEALVIQGLNNFASGRAAAATLLEQSEPPTAIFAGNDDMAAGLLYEMHSRNIQVPQEISLVGFDNTPFSQQVWPRLTTASQPFDDIGRTAASLLIDQFSGGDETAGEPTRPVTMDCELQLRESSAAL